MSASREDKFKFKTGENNVGEIHVTIFFSQEVIAILQFTNIKEKQADSHNLHSEGSWHLKDNSEK